MKGRETNFSLLKYPGNKVLCSKRFINRYKTAFNKLMFLDYSPAAKNIWEWKYTERVIACHYPGYQNLMVSLGLYRSPELFYSVSVNYIVQLVWWKLWNQKHTRKDVQNLLLIGKLHFNTYDLREISFKIKNTKLIDISVTLRKTQHIFLPCSIEIVSCSFV